VSNSLQYNNSIKTKHRNIPKTNGTNQVAHGVHDCSRHNFLPLRLPCKAVNQKTTKEWKYSLHSPFGPFMMEGGKLGTVILIKVNLLNKIQDGIMGRAVKFTLEADFLL